MIVTLELDADLKLPAQAAGMPSAVAQSLLTGVKEGEFAIVEFLQSGSSGLTMRHADAGLAASIDGWMIDESIPMAALGVPANSPAARYAAILNYGGVITPKSAGALAVPVSSQAKAVSSPRDMPNLVMIKRPGRPPLLVEAIKGRFGKGIGRMIIHWVLLKSVTIPATHWFDNAVTAALPRITGAFASRLRQLLGLEGANG